MTVVLVLPKRLCVAPANACIAACAMHLHCAFAIHVCHLVAYHLRTYGFRVPVCHLPVRSRLSRVNGDPARYMYIRHTASHSPTVAASVLQSGSDPVAYEHKARTTFDAMVGPARPPRRSRPGAPVVDCVSLERVRKRRAEGCIFHKTVSIQYYRQYCEEFGHSWTFVDRKDNK